jgi:DNA-binding response OmpR family regulator
MIYTNMQGNPRKGIEVLLASHESSHGPLDRIFRHSNWHLRHVQTCKKAIEFAKSNEIAVVVCERHLPDGDWTTVFAECETLARRPIVIVTAAMADEALWAEVLNLGGYDVLAQPFDPGEVFRVVSSAWRRWNDEIWPAA